MRIGARYPFLEDASPETCQPLPVLAQVPAAWGDGSYRFKDPCKNLKDHAMLFCVRDLARFWLIDID